MVSVAGRATGSDRGRPGGPRDTRERASLQRSASGVQSLSECPECGLPAEITGRFSLSSTDGPVEHVALACVDGHYFRMPLDGLPTEAAGSVTPADMRRAWSAPSSSIGFSRLPGTLGTVANADSATRHF
ncbi:MAG TPA: hypothetical protein VMA72_18195 [Streptosporangiaceae bacterium]|nr:hypothetical protein [Streptosporangiaceae bacterium]